MNTTLIRDLLWGFLAPLLIAVPAALFGVHARGYMPVWLPVALVVLAVVATTGNRRELLSAVRP